VEIKIILERLITFCNNYPITKRAGLLSLPPLHSLHKSPNLSQGKPMINLKLTNKKMTH
jgi:hypothetical protein